MGALGALLQPQSGGEVIPSLDARPFSLGELLRPYTIPDLWHRIKPKGALTGQCPTTDPHMGIDPGGWDLLL